VSQQPCRACGPAPRCGWAFAPRIARLFIHAAAKTVETVGGQRSQYWIYFSNRALKSRRAALSFSWIARTAIGITTLRFCLRASNKTHSYEQPSEFSVYPLRPDKENDQW
jgi:hypothetical protein